MGCYECGKQLKWEHICPDCGISNLDNDEEEQKGSTDDHSEYLNKKKSLESFMKEIWEICNKTGSEINTVNKDITENHEENTIKDCKEIIPKVNNGRDHKTMQSLNSKTVPEINNGRDHKIMQPLDSDEEKT